MLFRSLGVVQVDVQRIHIVLAGGRKFDDLPMQPLDQRVNYKPKNKLPIEEFLKPQRRFKHMFKPGNEWMIKEFQAEVDKRWQELLDLEELTNR